MGSAGFFSRRASVIGILLGSSLATGPLHAAVGASAGAGSVSVNGTPRYSMPIQPTEGIGAMTPRLSIEYVGPGRRTILGVGFDIAGISYITPCRRTIAQDLNAAPVTLTSADRYCLNGARLRLVGSGTYGASGTVYRTELDQLAQVTARDSVNNIPGWFEVKTRDGFNYEYGRAPDAKLLANGGANATPQFWAVNKISDRSNNSIHFQYTTNTATRTFQPAFIRYTDQSGVPGPYRIDFVYESDNRPDPVFAITSSTTGGAAHEELKRLQELRLVHEGITYRKFVFGYGTGAGKNSRLASVQECVPGAPDDCYPATTFGWQNAEAGYDPVAAESNDTVTSGILPLDLNGDGFEDVVWAESGTWRYKLGGVGGHGAEQNTGFAATNPSKAMSLEWNGDGFADLLVDWSDGKWRVLKGRASGGFMSPVHAGYNGGQLVSNQASNSWTVVDANNDGLDDLLRMAVNNVVLSIQIRLNTRVGSFVGFGAETTAYNNTDMRSQGLGFIRQNGASSVRRADFNGDGRTDILVYACEWVQVPKPGYCDWAGWFQFLSNGTTYTIGTALDNATFAVDVRYGDFNADGLTDLVYPAQTPGRWYLGYGQGGGGVAITAGPLIAGYATYQTMTGDYDGDGHDDFLVARSSTWDWEVFRSTGTGIAETPIAPGLDATGGGWMQTDANGDGLADLARYNSATFKWGTQVHLGLPGDRLVSVTDGLQNATAFAYLPMTDTAVYAKGSAAVFPARDFIASSPLVRRMTLSPAGATSQAFEYKYGGARIDSQGRGFLGMGKREVTDNRNGVFSSTTYRQDFPHIGAPSSVTVRQSSAANAKPIRSQAHTYQRHVLDATSGKERYLPYRSQTVTNGYEVGGLRDGSHITQVTETHTVNTWGNSIFVAVDVKDTDALSRETGLTYRTELTSTFVEDSTNWCIGPPLTRTEKRILPGGTSATRTTSWDVPTAECRVERQTLEPGAGNLISLVTDLRYDTCGNVDQVTTQPAGMAGQARVTNISYGSRCQRPETITNPEQHVSAISYNWALGLPVTQTDPNGLVTTLSYDGFGRLTRELRPDGTAARVALLACTAGNSWCGKNSSARVKVTRTERSTTDSVLRADEVFLDGPGRPRWTHSASLESGPAIVETLYDAFGRVSQQTQPYFAGSPVYATVLTRDLIGRVTSSNAPISEAQTNGRATGFAYEGRKLQVTDPANYVTTRTSNVLGQLSSLADPGTGGVSDYTYHPFGELASITDANGHVTNWTVNSRGFVTSTSDPDAGSWTYGVNAFGETTQIRDAKTVAPAWTTEFTFDALSRPKTRVESEGATNYTWGVAADNTASSKYIGRLKKVTSPGGYEENYTPDQLGRLRLLRTRIDGVNYDFDQSYSPTTGLPSSLTYPASHGSTRFKVDFTYQNNVLRSVAQNGGTTVYWTGNSTDAWGHYQDELFGNGILTIADFDQANGLMSGRMAGVGGGNARVDSLLAWGDLRGNVSQRQDLKLTPAVSESFVHDTISRLDTSTRNDAQNLDVNYGADGNILAKDGQAYIYTGAQAACSYSAHPQPHAVRKIGSTVYCYDANGNMTKRAGSGITYSSYNLPTVINSGSNSSTLSYGASRNRSKQVAVSSGTTETTIYVAGLFEKVTPPSGVIEYRHYIPGGDGIAAIHTRRSTGIYSTYYWHADHLGSPELFTDTGGTALMRPSFGAFGERRDGTDWLGSPSTTDLSVLAGITRRGFTGHEHLDAVGLIHMNGRVYDPAVARFLSADPILHVGLSQSLNSYSYTWNNPLAFTDPSGFDVTTPVRPFEFPPIDPMPYFGPPWEEPDRAENGGQGASLTTRDQQIDSAVAEDGFGIDDGVSFGVGLTPAGTYADVYTALTGEDVFTGEEITGFWRWVGILPWASEARKGLVATRRGLIGDVRAVSASIANAPFLTRGWNPPYSMGSRPRTFTTHSDLKFVRVTTDNPEGAFLVRQGEISGMTAEQIRAHLALPYMPTNILPVSVPAGTRMQTGFVAPQPRLGVLTRGGIQYQLLEPIPSSNFGGMSPIN